MRRNIAAPIKICVDVAIIVFATLREFIMRQVFKQMFQQIAAFADSPVLVFRRLHKILRYAKPASYIRCIFGSTP